MTRALPDDHAAATAHVWERWLPIWHGIFYLLLALPVALALLEPLGGRPWLAPALGVALAAWHWATIVRHPAWVLGERTGPLLASCGVTLGLGAALMAQHPAFLFLAGGLYLYMFCFLPLRWAVPGVAALTAFVVWRQIELLGDALPLWARVLFGLGAGAAIALALFIEAIMRQSAERQRLIDELAATRRELAAAEREAGILGERQRLAREIHDTLAQGFSGIVMHIEAAEAALPAGLVAAQRHLNQARRTARDGLAEARQLVWALRPELLASDALPEAIARVARRWSDETGTPADVAITGAACRLPPEREVTLLRAAQEGLANVRKHARATRVAITLSYLSDLVALDIQDDGVGFTAPPDDDGAPGHDAGGFGLLAMRERVARLGGTLTIESAPGRGATLAISLPSA